MSSLGESRMSYVLSCPLNCRPSGYFQTYFRCPVPSVTTVSLQASSLVKDAFGLNPARARHPSSRPTRAVDVDSSFILTSSEIMAMELANDAPPSILTTSKQGHASIQPGRAGGQLAGNGYVPNGTSRESSSQPKQIVDDEKRFTFVFPSQCQILFSIYELVTIAGQT